MAPAHILKVICKMFSALLVIKGDDGKTSASVESLSEDQLPEGDVTVAVEYSTVNYKDGLCIGPGGGLVRNYPHVPGIDFAGVVEKSDDTRYLSLIHISEPTRPY